MTPDELRALADAATPGPWFAGVDGEIVFVCADDGYEEIVCWNEGANQTKPDDARLIALAPSLARDHAALLDRQERVEAWAARVVAVLGEHPIKCPVHGIPDCSPLLNGCNLPSRIFALLVEWAEMQERERKDA